MTSVRAVFDCMIFLQAATNPEGPASACFRLVDDGTRSLCLSPEILAEVRVVLDRPKLRRKFPHLTTELVEEFLESVQSKAVTFDEVPTIFRYWRDPDDEPYINLAIVSDAGYLVSRDNDLLDLADDPAFRDQYPDLSIVDPIALLREMRPPETGEGTPDGSIGPDGPEG